MTFIIDICILVVPLTVSRSNSEDQVHRAKSKVFFIEGITLSAAHLSVHVLCVYHSWNQVDRNCIFISSLYITLYVPNALSSRFYAAAHGF